MIKKTSLSIGINYSNQDYALRGCINDADDWAVFLHKNGFETAVIAEAEATRRNVLQSVEALITDLKPGDTGVVTYSGHGTWVPDLDGDEPDGRDEALVPYDVGDDGSNLIIDDELHLLFNKIPAGTTLVFVTDCCNSGSAYRFFGNSVGQRRVRFLPPSHFIKDEALLARMDRAFGQARPRTNAPLPGLIHFSGCKDNEYSNDALINARFSGAMTFYALQAFHVVLTRHGTYQDAWANLRKHLPSWEYQQTPLLNATPALKKARLLG